jgi:type I restriction enzyme, S subunit
MADEWQTVRLSDVCEQITDGKHGDCRNSPSSGYFFLSAKDIRDGRLCYDGAREIDEFDFADTHRRTKLEPLDILYTNSGTIGRMAIARPEDQTDRTTFQKSVAILKPCQSKINPYFLYYLLRFDNARLSEFATGTTQKNLLLGDFRSFAVRVPPLPVQETIVGVLKSLDDKIELNRRMNQTLEALARAIFKSWFVDFDPVTAKAAGRQPIGMNAQTAALFPNSFEDSPLGPIPKGWRVGPFASIAEILMGTSPSGDTYNELGIGVPLINGPVEFGDFFPLKKKWTTAAARMSQAEDLIFCVRGSTTGRRVVADDVYCLGRGVCAIRSRNGWQGFVDLAVDNGLDALLTAATGSTFPSLNGPEIKGFTIVRAPDNLVSEFCRVVAPFRKRIRQNVRASVTLAALRDALLPRLLSGDLRVKIAEQIVTQAV